MGHVWHRQLLKFSCVVVKLFRGQDRLRIVVIQVVVILCVAFIDRYADSGK
jgi:hypothetical protein